MKTKIIPFDAKMAKDIQDGKIKGRVRTKGGGFTARIICFDKIKLVHGDGTTEKQIVSLIYNENAREDILVVHNQKGDVQTPFGWQHCYDLVIEVPDNEPQFKPFDKVLMRSPSSGYVCWYPHFYCRYIQNAGDKKPYVSLEGFGYEECIPYEGNEHLLGTTDKPKEE